MDDMISSNIPHSNLSAIPTASGIYKITCTTNGRFYIGSSTNLRRRQSHHWSWLRQNRHYNPHMQRAWNKYGEQAFTFEVLELVLPMDPTGREKYWLNKLKPFGRKGFNSARDAKLPTSRRGKKQPPEAVEKLRQFHLGRKKSPEAIEKSAAARRGRKCTPEQNEHNRQAQLGKKMSPATIEKQRQRMLGNTVNLGRVPPNKGIKMSSEAIERNRQAQLRPEVQEKHLGRKQTPEAIEKVRQARLGKKHTPEAIENMKQAWIKRRVKTE